MATPPAPSPSDLDTLFARARALHMAGRRREAAELYQQILQQDPRHADSLHLFGVLFLERKRYLQAAELIGQAIAANPMVAKYHSNLGTVLRESGRHEEAVAAFRRALEIEPGFIDALHNLGSACLDAGDRAGAKEAFEAALKIDGSFPHALGGLGWLLQQEGDLTRADELTRRAFDLAPAEDAFGINLASIRLKRGDAAGSLELCDRFIGQERQPIRALALKAIALAEAGEGSAARRLMDLEHLIFSEEPPPPAGYSGMAAFNRDLTKLVAGHSTLMRSPPSHATRSGWHTGELAQEDHPAIRGLRALIEGEIARRTANNETEPNCPFASRAPERYKLNIWGVVMESQGHQIAHIHPSAWLSGVYYPSLPPEVASGEEGAGWIEFGRGDEDFYHATAPVTRMIRPREGLLVTFPSFFWHRTIPFESAARRTSVAFDVVPVKGEATTD